MFSITSLHARITKLANIKATRLSGDAVPRRAINCGWLVMKCLIHVTF